VTVIDEVPVIEVTVIKPTAGNHGTTMYATTGKTTHTTTHATHVATAHAAHMPTAAGDERAPAAHMATTAAAAAAAAVDRNYCADMIGTHNVLEVRRICYRMS
jgi:type IV secretory pathway VirB9-like protein